VLWLGHHFHFHPFDSCYADPSLVFQQPYHNHYFLGTLLGLLLYEDGPGP
jgi:hypothetical protein